MSGSRPARTLAAAAVLSVAACSDSSGPADPGTPPERPAVASMQADLSLFATQSAVVGEQATAPGTHFVAGAIAVTVARFWTGVVMAVPVATWAAAASDTPEFRDGAWHWEYSATENGRTFAADLAGVVEGSESLWEMRVSASATNPPLDNYLWYTGRAALAGSQGEWHIFDAALPATRTEVLAIDWTHPSTTLWTLTFTNVRSGSAEFGDELYFESNGDQRTVRFTDSSAQTTSTVAWSHSTGAGWVQAPGYNGGVRSCWDSALQNVICP